MKNLNLNKKIISVLNRMEQKEIKAGEVEPCWENLYTAYNCDVAYTKPTS